MAWTGPPPGPACLGQGFQSRAVIAVAGDQIEGREPRGLQCRQGGDHPILALVLLAAVEAPDTEDHALAAEAPAGAGLGAIAG